MQTEIPRVHVLFAVLAATLALAWPAPTSAAPRAQASKSISYAQKTFQLDRPDQKERFTVGCRGNTYPLGGGMISSPTPGAEGEGVYPHSYERLGVQRGFHVTATLFDPTPRSTQSRSVTLQVACRKDHRHVTPPHRTTYLSPGQTKTVVATCPGRRHLFSGGFQRTDFISTGGDFVTASYAISSKSWAVTGHAFGSFGGELTAIAYCWRSKGPLLTPVSASTSVSPGSFGTATTPPCAKGHLISGGFASSPADTGFFTNGMFNPDGSWSASLYNQFGPAATLAAYGYCVKG